MSGSDRPTNEYICAVGDKIVWFNGARSMDEFIRWYAPTKMAVGGEFYFMDYKIRAAVPEEWTKLQLLLLALPEKYQKGRLP